MNALFLKKKKNIIHSAEKQMIHLIRPNQPVLAFDIQQTNVTQFPREISAYILYYILHIGDNVSLVIA